MAFVYFGTHKALVGIDEVLSRCPACEADTFHEILITSNYFHIYVMPVCPVEKEVSFVCKKCGMRRKDVPLTPKTLSNYEEINKKFRHPWYTYFFILLIGVLILIALLTSIFSQT